MVCRSCEERIGYDSCPLCRVPSTDSPAEVLSRLRRHVENDVPEAINQLGELYRTGDETFGIVKSYKKAAKIFKRGVELGSVDAMVSLGRLFSTGRGVKLDKKKAMQLYKMSADRGFAPAQYNLGCLLNEHQRGDEAFRYFSLSAEQNYTDAEFNLAYCCGRGVGTEKDDYKARFWYARAAAKGDERAKEKLEDLERFLAEQAQASKPS